MKFILASVLVISVLALIVNPVFAQISSPVSVNVDKTSYSTNDLISITGTVRDLYSGTPISIMLKDFNENILTITQVQVNSDKTFNVEVIADDSISMIYSGTYTVTAQYGTEKRSSSTSFNFVGETNPTQVSNASKVSEIADVKSNQVTIVAADGSGVPGCEETADGCYIPSTVRVNVDDTIIFSNPDTAAHTFTSGTSGGNDIAVLFDSSLVMAGSSYEYSPDTVGEIPYFCMVHPWMQGTIIVVDEEDSSVAGITMPPQISTQNNDALVVENQMLREEIRDLKTQVKSQQDEIESLKDQIVSMTKEFVNSLQQLNEWFGTQLKS